MRISTFIENNKSQTKPSLFAQIDNRRISVTFTVIAGVKAYRLDITDENNYGAYTFVSYATSPINALLSYLNPFSNIYRNHTRHEFMR